MSNFAKSVGKCLIFTKKVLFNIEKPLRVLHCDFGNFLRLHPTQARNFLLPPLCKGRCRPKGDGGIGYLILKSCFAFSIVILAISSCLLCVKGGVAQGRRRDWLLNFKELFRVFHSNFGDFLGLYSTQACNFLAG